MLFFLVVVCYERGCPSIYIRRKAVLGTIIGTRTKLHCLHMEACHRLSKERTSGASRGSVAPWVGHPLTTFGGHRLWSVGSWLDLECIPVVASVQSSSLDGPLYVSLA